MKLNKLHNLPPDITNKNPNSNFYDIQIFNYEVDICKYIPQYLDLILVFTNRIS